LISAILSFTALTIVSLPITLAIYGLILYVVFQMRNSFDKK
jgi:heme/copper-type cytochrome/quinol oxidase subunit 2